jgi:ATP-binding cassette subfamily B protein/subfamily B ATP-binding cassette protein MsbA
MHAYRTLLRLALRQWPALLVVVGLGAALGSLAALLPWPTKILVDYALGDVGLPLQLEALLVWMGLEATPTVLIAAAAVTSLALYALMTLLEFALTWIWSNASQRMLYDVSARLFHQLQRAPVPVHARRGTGDALARISEDSWSVCGLADSLLVAPLRQALTLVSIGTLAWMLDPMLAVLSLVSVPAVAGSVAFFGGRIKGRARDLRETRSRLTSFVHQTLAAVPVVQAFGMEDLNRDRFRMLATRATAASQTGMLIRSSFSLLNGSAMAIATALVLCVGGMRALHGALSVGSLLVFLSYQRSVRDASQSLLGTYGKLRSIEASMDRVIEVLESDEGVRDVAGAQPLAGRVRGQVRLEDVVFGYVAGRPVLEGVSLEVRRGETLALVGPTGAGKSTLVSLILRFFDPWSGRVTLDGRDVRDVTLASLRSQVSLVLQEPFLLPLSVAENIAYGRPGASREEITAAAQAANADDFIRRLPQGYDSVLGERGATLSGGEQQRLAIARAVLKDAPVLILDEPTSALDSQSEGLVLEALGRLASERTTFLIAHRLSTVRTADRIAVIDGGRLVELGTHHELLATRGLYRKLHELQDLGAELGQEVA